MVIMSIFRWLLLIIEVVVALPILYLCIVSGSAIACARELKKKAGFLLSSLPTPANFAILIPAHNEIELLGDLLESLANLEYPKDHYSVFVVADNCTDTTAELARATGLVQVYERFDQTKRGKGFALNWLLQQLEQDQLYFDAYVIIDADSVVESTFLSAMNAEFGQGARALQARYTVLNATESPSTALRWIALSLMNYVRPLGRNGLGMSSTLTGNGMCFSRALLELHPWQAFSLTEDYQYYLYLVQHGERVHFVPDAIVRSQMPTTFAQMRTQDIRWEAYGNGQPVWKLAAKLLTAGIVRRDLMRLEAAAELLTPPLSFLASGCMLTLIASVALWYVPAMCISSVIITGLICYIGTAFATLQPPRSVYFALLHAPVFMVWKLWVNLALKRNKRYTGEWVRTSRTV